MKSQCYKLPKAIETKGSLLGRCCLFTALMTMVVVSSNTSADQFLVAPCASSTTTFACFQVKINPNFAYLMDPGSGAAVNPYPGWSSPFLTSPGLQDDRTLIPSTTVISESAGRTAPPTFGTYPGGGIQIGDSGGCGGSLYSYTMLSSGPSSFSSYAYPTFGWQYPPPSTPLSPNPATLTEIQYFTLTSFFSQGASCPPGTSSLYPATSPSAAQSILVRSGYQNLGDPARRSIGMLVSLAPGAVPGPNNFPAESFFDVFVQVVLPIIPNTVSGNGASGSPVFPAGGALLINDSAHPLIVANSSLTGFPTVGTNGIFYTHSAATPAVPLVFEFDNFNPGYPGDGSGKPYWWHKGDTFGWIQLAGHGIFNPCAKSTLNWDSFMATVLGSAGHMQPSAPVGGLFPNAQYPWPTSSYSMAQGTNFGGQAWDAITFSNASTISAAYLTLTNFEMPVALPGFGSSITYTNTNTIANISWSLFGLTDYVPTQSTGTVVVYITNTNTPINGVTTYTTALLQCDFSGLADFGQWSLQLDSTKPNAGIHTVQSLPQGAVRVTGYFDARFQVSANGGQTWTDSDAPNRLYLGDSPCGASIEPIHCKLTGSNLLIDWANPSYSLEGTVSMNPPSWVPIPGPSPATVPAAGSFKFFRLSCQ